MAAPTVTVNMVCQQFDPALGQLTDYGFNGGASPVAVSTFTFQNNGSAPPSGNFLFAFNIVAKGVLPGGGVIEIDWLDGAPSPTSPAPGGTTTFTSPLEFLAVSNGYQPQTASLTSYIGTGTFTIPITITANNITSSNYYDPSIALTDFSSTVTSQPFLEMIYDPPFTPTPEPATWGFMVFGVTGTALVLNRRQTAAKV